MKSSLQLFDLYCKSVGRGASFLLNVPPNRLGQIDAPDAASLRAFGVLIRKTFARNLAAHSKIIATNVRGDAPRFGARNLLSESQEKFWATDDSATSADVEIVLDSEKTFSLIRLREPIQLGQRIEKFAVDGWLDGQYREIAKGSTIGNCRLLRLPRAFTTSKLRIRVLKSPACVLLYGFGLFKDPSS